MRKVLLPLILVATAIAQAPPADITRLRDLSAQLSAAIDTSAASYASLQTTNEGLTLEMLALRAQLATVQATVAWATKLDAVCPTCRAAIESGVSGQSGQLDGVLICCGPATVPPTKPGAALIYIAPRYQAQAK